MKEVIIGYQGVPGAYSEMAADKFVSKYKKTDSIRHKD
jgi:hypothetical protein